MQLPLPPSKKGTYKPSPKCKTSHSGNAFCIFLLKKKCQIQYALRCQGTCCEQRRVARIRYSDCRYVREGKESDVGSCQRCSFDSPTFRHRQPVAQPTGTAGIMASGRGFCILGVKTCQRCIEHLVFRLFDRGVGEFDRRSRIGLGSLGPFL